MLNHIEIPHPDYVPGPLFITAPRPSPSLRQPAPTPRAPRVTRSIYGHLAQLRVVSQTPLSPSRAHDPPPATLPALARRRADPWPPASAPRPRSLADPWRSSAQTHTTYSPPWREKGLLCLQIKTPPSPSSPCTAWRCPYATAPTPTPSAPRPCSSASSAPSPSRCGANRVVLGLHPKQPSWTLPARLSAPRGAGLCPSGAQRAQPDAVPPHHSTRQHPSIKCPLPSAVCEGGPSIKVNHLVSASSAAQARKRSRTSQ
jgi:hypothetical protein